MRTHYIPSCCKKSKRSFLLPDLALLSTLIGSNYPCLELIFGLEGVRATEVLLYVTIYTIHTKITNTKIIGHAELSKQLLSGMNRIMTSKQ